MVRHNSSLDIYLKKSPFSSQASTSCFISPQLNMKWHQDDFINKDSFFDVHIYSCRPLLPTPALFFWRLFHRYRKYYFCFVPKVSLNDLSSSKLITSHYAVTQQFKLFFQLFITTRQSSGSYTEKFIKLKSPRPEIYCYNTENWSP